VPIWLLSGLGADRFSLGQDAVFQGIVELERRRGQWFGNIRGSFADIDMSQINERIGSRIRGACRVDNLNLVIEADRISQAELQVTSDEGELQPELLKALGSLPNIEIQSTLESHNSIRYHNLAIRLRLQDGLCTLLPAWETGLLMEDGEQSPLLRLDPAKSSQVDLEYLARTLVEPDCPAGLVDNKMVNILGYFHLPTLSRSAQRTSNANSRQY
jgi:hypothetical protein